MVVNSLFRGSYRERFDKKNFIVSFKLLKIYIKINLKIILKNSGLKKVKSMIFQSLFSNFTYIFEKKIPISFNEIRSLLPSTSFVIYLITYNKIKQAAYLNNSTFLRTGMEVSN